MLADAQRHLITEDMRRQYFRRTLRLFGILGRGPPTADELSTTKLASLRAGEHRSRRSEYRRSIPRFTSMTVRLRIWEELTVRASGRMQVVRAPIFAKSWAAVPRFVCGQANGRCSSPATLRTRLRRPEPRA